MKLTTIFTGHTLDLRSIVAIGPIFMDVKRTIVEPHLSMMIIEIHLSGGTVITHVYAKMKTAEFDEKKWTEKHDELLKLRAELVAAWEQNLKLPPLPHYLTSDIEAIYKKPKKDDH